MINWRIKIIKDKSDNILYNYNKNNKKIENLFENFNIEKDLNILQIEDNYKDILKWLDDIESTKLNFLKLKKYWEFKITKKGEIRYFQWKNDDTIIEITTENILLENWENYIQNIDLWFVSNTNFKEDIENKITLELLKKNKKKLNNIFIENATLNEWENEEKIFLQKTNTFLLEKENLDYNIRTILLENYKKIFTHFYWYFKVFYQNYFLKNWTNFYPVNVYFKNNWDWIIEAEWYEIIWEPIIINNLFYLIDQKKWVVYKDDYLWKKDFYNVNTILEWL